MLKLICYGCILLLLYGCTTHVPVVMDNEPKQSTDACMSYALHSWNRESKNKSDEMLMLLAFSGGGTRAAALA